MNFGKNDLLVLIREGRPMTLRQQLLLTVQLSIPAMVAQLSSIVMQYIDAAMVGSLGANASASIGLVSTTTWLFSGLCSAASTGFAVQVAHCIGGGKFDEARQVLRQSIVLVLMFSLLLAGVGIGISGVLPQWLGGAEAINRDASVYFMIYASFLPMMQLCFLAGGMLRCSGNMRVPSMLNVLMCLLDVVFNFFLIFPSRSFSLFGMDVFVPGAGWGVAGAAVGTGLAELVVAGLMLWYLAFRSKELGFMHEKGHFRPTSVVLRKAVHIGGPMGIEHAVICGAQILTTVIVAPLGVFAIAANSFAITAESLCYMPGYGIADAATTLVGQSMGAGRKDLTRRFARITVGMGMAVMGVMGVIMYIAAPLIIGTMTPDAEVLELGVQALRITDVCGGDCGLRCVRRGGEYGHSLPDEFLQHLGGTPDLGCLAGSVNGVERCVACDVHRIMFPRHHLLDSSGAGQVDENLKPVPQSQHQVIRILELA